MLIWASLALPFHSRQRRRSTSSTITVFAATRAASSVDNPAGYLLQVLQPHRDVEPVEDRRLGDAGGGQYGSESGTSVGEPGQLRVVGLADGREVPADQLHDVGIGFGDLWASQRY